MSRRAQSKTAKAKANVAIFRALGDETRLSLVDLLASGGSYSITQLAENYQQTRQGITKHLRVLENAGLV